MNIYMLDENPRLAGALVHDEDLQIRLSDACDAMASALLAHGVSVGLQPWYADHVLSQWVGKRRGNFEWVLAYAESMAEKWAIETGEEAESAGLLPKFRANMGVVPEGGMTRMPVCLPDKYKRPVVDSYKDFYREKYIGMSYEELVREKSCDCGAGKKEKCHG